MAPFYTLATTTALLVASAAAAPYSTASNIPRDAVTRRTPTKAATSGTTITPAGTGDWKPSEDSSTARPFDIMEIWSMFDKVQAQHHSPPTKATTATKTITTTPSKASLTTQPTDIMGIMSVLMQKATVVPKDLK
jgi:hypothetical protein